jgi:hypothetical protein
MYLKSFLGMKKFSCYSDFGKNDLKIKNEASMDMYFQTAEKRGEKISTQFAKFLDLDFQRCRRRRRRFR